MQIRHPSRLVVKEKEKIKTSPDDKNKPYENEISSVLINTN